MSRSEIFQDTTDSKDGRMPRNLRFQAHEFADWSHALEPVHHTDHTITNRRYGRGASGESST
jgi:hypothetical protein